MACIQLEHLVKEYRMSSSGRFRAVDDLSLTVSRGEILGLLGENGAGKTTTIKMILGLMEPDQGRISVCGHDVSRQRSRVLQRVGAVLEGNRNIYWDLTVVENLRYWGTLKGVPRGILADRVDELIRFFQLEEKRSVVGKHLSRGMQQKLAIASALIHNPDVLLLDEPTLGLDVGAAATVKERVAELASARGCTIVLTTHQLDVAQDLCHRVAIMRRGRLIALSSTTELLRGFSRSEYAITIKGEARPMVSSTHNAEVRVEGEGPTWTIRVLLHEDSGIYEIMDQLKRAGSVIVGITKVEADLEHVFLSLTGARTEAGIAAEVLQNA